MREPLDAGIQSLLDRRIIRECKLLLDGLLSVFDIPDILFEDALIIAKLLEIALDAVELLLLLPECRNLIEIRSMGKGQCTKTALVFHRRLRSLHKHLQAVSEIQPLCDLRRLGPVLLQRLDERMHLCIERLLLLILKIQPLLRLFADIECILQHLFLREALILFLEAPDPILELRCFFRKSGNLCFQLGDALL